MMKLTLRMNEDGNKYACRNIVTFLGDVIVAYDKHYLLTLITANIIIKR